MMLLIYIKNFATRINREKHNNESVDEMLVGDIERESRRKESFLHNNEASIKFKVINEEETFNYTNFNISVHDSILVIVDGQQQ